MLKLNEKVDDYTIVGIVTSEIFIMQCPSKDFTNLDKADKDWRQKPVYIVKFDTPRKNASIEDLQRLYPDMNYVDIEAIYNSLPLYQYQNLIASLVEKRIMFKPGDYYEDCCYHPCLCIYVDGDDITGLSLVDGDTPRHCSIKHCGIEKLSLNEAINLRMKGPPPNVKNYLIEFYKDKSDWKPWWNV